MTIKVLYIVRGVSGSGKSTLCKEILKDEGAEEGTILSTDDYFMKKDQYVFDPKKLGVAHEWNQDRAEKAIKEGKTPILIDNTNTTRWEAKPYVQMALKAKYEVKIRETTTPWAKNAEILAKKNVHKVPLEAIRRMLDRWEDDYTVERILKSKAPKRHRKQQHHHKKKNNKGVPDMIQAVITNKSNITPHMKNMFPDTFGHHATIAFKPSEAFYKKLLGCGLAEGDPIDLHVDAHVSSASFGVETLRLTHLSAPKQNGMTIICANKVPHVTLSIHKQKGRKPVDSNKLLSMSFNDKKEETLNNVVIPATLTFVNW
mmetsp:Transcript_3735/g.5523  ORF Transcript_3735/g.5523 Transcript_3735/m.5523 type:complete len:315 (+) Transcript_3735:43-987(+)